MRYQSTEGGELAVLRDGRCAWRGGAGVDLTCELAFRLARAARHAFRPRRALLAQGTPISGPGSCLRWVPARPAAQTAIHHALAVLNGTGRLAVCPFIRIMAEGPDEAVLLTVVRAVRAALKRLARPTP